MPETGKIDPDFFAEYIASRLGAQRSDIRKGPAPGIDFGVVDVGSNAVVVATDPLSILPALGYERAGRFAIRFVLADVAVSGVAPSHLAVSFALPPETTDEEFGAVWMAIDEECTDLGVSVITGHTARYEGCSFPWIGHGTAFAVGEPADIIYPDGATPGDLLLVTKGPAVEATGLLSTLFPDQIPLDEETLASAQTCLDRTDSVRDSRALAESGGINAMHDATEGGLLGAFHELADSAGVKLTVDTDAIPAQPAVLAVADVLGMDPWCATTAGTLVVAVDPDHCDSALAALDSRGTPAGVVGRVTEGSGVVVDDDRSSPPAGDSSWPVYERLLEDT